MNTGIYEIRNLVNGKRYVGSAVSFGNRWRQHAQSLARGDHHSRALQRAWARYSPRAFQFNKLLACSKENLIMYEQICIDALKPEYNCAPKAGSQLGFKHSAEARERMSAANNRRGNPGHVHTAESKERISANRAGKGGGPMAAERRAKIGAAHKGRVITEEQRAKISATLTGHKQSAEQIEKRVQKLRGRKMPPGFAEAASARMKGMVLGSSHRSAIARSKAKLTDVQVQNVRARLDAGEKQRVIASDYLVDQSVISEIKTGKSYQWVA
jgi:group I intron endonuclease